MGAFEELLRKALLKQGGGDALAREKVYQSARAALDRLLEKQQNLSAEQIKFQKNNLETSIVGIEAEYRAKEQPLSPAQVGMPNMAGQVNSYAQYSPIQTPITPQAPIAQQAQIKTPVVAPQQQSPVQKQPKLNIPSMDSNGVVLEDQNKKHPFAKLMLWSTLVAFVVLGSWWVYEQQLFVPLSVRDGAVPNPQKNLESEDFNPNNTGASKTDAANQAAVSNDEKLIVSFPKMSGDYKTDDKGWIDVLDPNDPRGVILNDRGTAEILTENGEQILRLRSLKEGEAGDKNERAIKIEIGNGLAKSLAGKTVDLLLEMRSSDNDKHKISVVCAFGALGQCGRRWYQVSPEKQNVLIEFQLQDGDVQSGSNFLLIYTDDENTGKGVDIYGIKMMIK